MLNINEINFPITFKFPIQQPITFNDAVSNGVWQVSGEESNLPLEYFIEQHNKQNPYNEPHKRHYYEMAEKKESCGWFFTKTGEMIIGNAYIKSGIISANIEKICKIEDVPVGATIKGIKRSAEGWDDITFKPLRIEVHDDTITLLSGYGGFNKNSSYGLELNIKRGTKVKYSTNC